MTLASSRWMLVACVLAGRMQRESRSTGAGAAGALYAGHAGADGKRRHRRHRRSRSSKPISVSACSAAWSRVRSMSAIRSTKGQTVAAIDPAALELAVRSAAGRTLEQPGADCATPPALKAASACCSKPMPPAARTFEPPSRRAKPPRRRSFAREANLTKAQRAAWLCASSESDFDGVVTAVGAEVGQVVSPGQSVVTVARPDIREAVVDVPDEAAGALRIGHAVST